MRIAWKKTLVVLLDVVLGVYIVLAFTAFNKPDDRQMMCTGVSITIADGSNNGFINAAEIKKRLVAAGIYPKGKPMRYVDARKIENHLKRSPFVKSAECYKTQSGNVYINITQLLPVIRIKADNGADYYVDDKNSVMPNSSYVSNLIIATGNITPTFATNYMSTMGKTIMANDLWRNLIEQINVLPGGDVEIVPRVGNHVVYLGHLPEKRRGVDHEQAIAAFVTNKMSRLVKFYKYGLSHAGWNKYSYINLEFDNQIICKKSRSYKAALKQSQIANAAQSHTAKPAQSPTTTTASTGTTQSAATTATSKEKPAVGTTEPSTSTAKPSTSTTKSTTNSKKKP